MSGGGAAASSTLRRERVRTAWLFLLPVIVVLAAVAAWPLMRTIWIGFTDAYLGGVDEAGFVGFANYWIVLDDPVWWGAVRNTLVFTVCSVGIEVVLGMIVALVLHHAFPGRALVRAAVLIPWAIPTVVSAKIWAWMLNDQFGVINSGLMVLGLIGEPVAWTADATLAMAAVIAVDVWKTTPFMALLILAGLQMVPNDYYEAARVDGVSPLVRFFRITLPLIRPALAVAVIFRTLDALRIFDLIYVLTANSDATMSMSVYARQQLVEFGDAGIGSAASTLLFMVVAGVSVLVAMGLGVGDEEGAR